MAQAATLQALRAKIREMEGVAPTSARRVRVGVSQFDDLIGGLPRPGILEICGALGSGRTHLALALVSACVRHRELVAWVDWHERLYPLGLSEAELCALLIAQPAAQQGEWVTEQLLRSGCFPVVIVADPQGIKRGVRWRLAAEQGHTSLIVLSRRPSLKLSPDVRLSLSNRTVCVVRDRTGQRGQRVPLDSVTAS